MVAPRKNPAALFAFWRATPVAFVDLPPVLAKVMVNTPVFGLIEPVNEFIGLPGNFTNVSLLVTATLKVRLESALPPEISSVPDGRSIAAVFGEGLVHGEPCTTIEFVKPFA